MSVRRLENGPSRVLPRLRLATRFDPGLPASDGDERPTLPYGEGQLQVLCEEAGPGATEAVDVGGEWFAAAATAEQTGSLMPCALDAVEAECSPDAHARRHHLQRVVAVVACLCAILCVVAGARRASGRERDSGSTSATSGDVRRAPPAASIPLAEARAVASPAPEPSRAAPRPVETARSEREKARRAPERGQARPAADAAARATALDANDAEGWLLLGAADLALGDALAARSAFAHCVAQAKTGPVRACRALLSR